MNCIKYHPPWKPVCICCLREWPLQLSKKHNHTRLEMQRGKLAIKGTDNHTAFVSPVCVCNRFLKNPCKRLKIPKVTFLGPNTCFIRCKADENPKALSNTQPYYTFSLLALFPSLMIVWLAFQKLVQTIYAMNSDVTWFKEGLHEAKAAML